MQCFKSLNASTTAAAVLFEVVGKKFFVGNEICTTTWKSPLAQACSMLQNALSVTSLLRATLLLGYRLVKFLIA